MRCCCNAGLRRNLEEGTKYGWCGTELMWWRPHIKLFYPCRGSYWYMMVLGHLVGFNFELDSRVLGYY